MGKNKKANIQHIEEVDEDREITELHDQADEEYNKEMGHHFRIHNRFLLLTYKYHWPKDAASEYFKGKHGAQYVNVSHETGARFIPYEHTHIVVSFPRPFTTTNCRIFDSTWENDEVVHPNIRFLCYRKAYLDAIKYIRKEDKQPLIEEPDLVLNVFDDCQGLTRTEMLKKCRSFTEVPGCLALANITCKSEIDIPAIILRDWQHSIIKLLKMPGDRSVHWFCDLEGGKGKSTFARYMYAAHPDDTLVLSALGGVRDCATIIDGAYMRGWNGQLLILDLARAAEHKAIYEPIEQIKNGFMNTTKYQGKELWLKRIPHVVIFANFPPDKSQMSADRWKVWYFNQTNNEPLWERRI